MLTWLFLLLNLSKLLSYDLTFSVGFTWGHIYEASSKTFRVASELLLLLFFWVAVRLFLWMHLEDTWFIVPTNYLNPNAKYFKDLMQQALNIFYSQKLHRIYQILVYNFVCCVRNASSCVQIVCGHGIWWFGLFISINITFQWKIHQRKYWDTDRRQVFGTKLYQTEKKCLYSKGCLSA